MNLISIAYLVEIITIILNYLLDVNALVLFWVINMLSIGVVSSLLGKDAPKRGLTKGHSFWALLGILGVIIYHLVFARKHPVKV